MQSHQAALLVILMGDKDGSEGGDTSGSSLKTCSMKGNFLLNQTSVWMYENTEGELQNILISQINLLKI